MFPGCLLNSKVTYYPQMKIATGASHIVADLVIY